jgi:membrane protease YdiL (CAAX protease family)
MSSIAILYWVFAFRSFKLWKVTKAVSLLNFFFYFFGSFVICGILYLMMFWPGGPTLIYQSFKVYLFLCAFSIIYSFFKYKENKFVLWNNVKIGFQKFSLILVLGFILYLIPNELRIKLFAINPDEARTAIEEFHE